MDQEESRIQAALDVAVRAEALRPKIEAIVARVAQKLRESPDAVLAWEPIPLAFYTAPLPETIRSSWVFILRANTTTGAERHPNSHQHMIRVVRWIRMPVSSWDFTPFALQGIPASGPRPLPPR